MFQVPNERYNWFAIIRMVCGNNTHAGGTNIIVPTELLLWISQFTRAPRSPTPTGLITELFASSPFTFVTNGHRAHCIFHNVWLSCHKYNRRVGVGLLLYHTLVSKRACQISSYKLSKHQAIFLAVYLYKSKHRGLASDPTCSHLETWDRS